MDVSDGCQIFSEPEVAPGGASPDGVQHGVTYRDELWPIDQKSDPNTGAVIFRYYFLDGTPAQHNAVTTTIRTSEKPANQNFVTWEDCANVQFRPVDDVQQADLRITFKRVPPRNPCWSSVGVHAKSRVSPNPTMGFCGVATPGSNLALDRRHLLHEFGHALGLRHEHQSVTAGGPKPYNPLATNYTRFDVESIMIYSRFNGQEIPLPLELSRFDMAFITLLYPPDLREGIEGSEQRRARFEQALVDAGLGDVANRILKTFGGRDDSRPLYRRLSAVRKEVLYRNDVRKTAYQANGIFLDSLNPSAFNQRYITDYVHGAAENKLFQAIIKNIVTNVFQRNGIKIVQPQPKLSSTEVREMIGALSMREEVITQVKRCNALLSGIDSGDSAEPRTEENENEERSPNRPLLDRKEWDKSASRSAPAHVEKSAGSGYITITIEGPKRKIQLRDESNEVRKLNIDVKGILHFSREDNLEHGLYAHWTPEDIVFFQSDLTITARFIPFEKGKGSMTDLGPETKIITGVEWS